MADISRAAKKVQKREVDSCDPVFLVKKKGWLRVKAGSGANGIGGLFSK